MVAVYIRFSCLYFAKHEMKSLFTRDSPLRSQNASQLLPDFCSEMQRYNTVQKSLNIKGSKPT